MLGINIPYDDFVLTTNGSKCISHLTPGDILYEYGTSEPLEVQEVIKTDIQTIWSIEYNDKRKMHGTESTPIIYGDRMFPLKDAVRIGKYPPLPTFALDFYKGHIESPLFPDPYMAGALLIHGDYDDEYVNLPIETRATPNNFIRFKTTSAIAEILGEDKIYFHWKHKSSTERIKWKEYFPPVHMMYVTWRQAGTPIIPVSYMRASINDREKFIRGVFDVGYNRSVIPDNVGTMNCELTHLEEVQKMLWSLGYLSKIVYNPMIKLSNGKNWRLELLGNYQNYPGVFYDISHIRHALDRDNKIVPKEPNMRLKIKKIERIGRGYTYKVRVNKPHAICVTSNFLPKVTI
ncbi:MAG: hypothetical protein NC548_12965 [Lachnospiraceae bacterium]|nr:hypothetical protein [Lachnospiraceae bacterium]MCM1230698.1 hypothetical protein [Ruminococcus flavefaciens]